MIMRAREGEIERAKTSVPLNTSASPDRNTPADDLDHDNHHRGTLSVPGVPAARVTAAAASATALELASVAEACADLQSAASLADGDTSRIDCPLLVPTWADARNP